MGKWCRQYVIDKKDSPDDAVTASIKKFIEHYGYKPYMLTAGMEFLGQLHVRTDVEVMYEQIPERNFRLYEVVIHRTPKVLRVQRIPAR